MSSLSCGEVLEAVLGQQARGAVDVERVLGGVGQLGEGGRELRRGTRARWPAASGRRGAVQHPRAEAQPDQALVEVGRRPVGEAGVDGRSKVKHALGHAAGRGDDDDHQDLRLEQQDLDVADRRGVDRRRGDDRQQVGDLRERLGGHAHRLVDLAADERQLEAALAAPRGAAAAGGRRSSGSPASVGTRPGGGVRVREQAVLLEHRELVADRRRAEVDLGVGGQRLRAHGLAGRGVGLDDLAQDQLLAGREHHTDCRRAAPRLRRPGRPRSRPRRCG